MAPINVIRLALATFGVMFLSGVPAVAQTITTLHNFTGGSTDGQNPGGSLFLFQGTLFGLATTGGTGLDGTLFKIQPDGSSYATLHSFQGLPNDGRSPTGSLTSDGTFLYGVTAGGGPSNAGTVFRISPDGSNPALLYSFTGPIDGEIPLGSAAISGSTLYTMPSGGGTSNLGTAFKINTDGSSPATIHSFTGTSGDGGYPDLGSLVASGGLLYGMTLEGGPAGQGVIFRMNADGTGFSLLHAFSASTGDGWQPHGSLTLVGSTLYGMTYQGGGGAGTIFKINTDGSGYARLHTFQGQLGNDGASPLGELLIAGSEMYGMTSAGGTANLGTIFEMNVDGTDYATLHSFVGGANDGALPAGGLILIGSSLYGLTNEGGSANDGIIFSFPVSVPEPSSLLLTAAAGAALLARRKCRGRGEKA